MNDLPLPCLYLLQVLIVSLRCLSFAIVENDLLWFWGAYHLAKKSGDFGLISNGKIIVRQFRLEILEVLYNFQTKFPSEIS